MSKLNVTIHDHTYNVEVVIQPGDLGAEVMALVDGEALRVAVSCLDSPDQIGWIAIDNCPYEDEDGE